MASLIPISTYNLAIDPFMPVAAIEEEYPITIRITLAALDPEAADDKEEPSTLRLLKRSAPFLDDEDDEDEDDEEDELDEESEEEEEEEKPKSKKFTKKDAEDEDEDDEEEGSDDEDEDDVSEYVICTLSPKTAFQQPIDITISPDEEVYFVVTGSYPIHLTGNYVEHPGDESSEDEDEDEDDYIYGDDEYDLTPDEDELIDIEDLEDEQDIEGKIEELVEEDNKKRTNDEDVQPKKKSKKEDKKSVAFTPELEQGPSGSTLTEKKTEKKNDKKEKAQAKKEEAKAKKEEAKAKKEEAKAAEPAKKFVTKTLLGGVVTEDRKTGKGTQAKGGNKVGIRYIGKLKNGKVFDKNTNGKPFTFNLGKGECIKGFDLGVAGMAVGGERRVVIPAKMGYGSQALPGIPANSELTFDIKLVSLK